MNKKKIPESHPAVLESGAILEVNPVVDFDTLVEESHKAYAPDPIYDVANLRDQFAMAAIQSGSLVDFNSISGGPVRLGANWTTDIARNAYAIADAMLYIRSVKNTA